MHFKWSQISSLLEEAEEKSQVTIEFSSKRLAELFRYSVYNFRRSKKIHQDLKVVITEEEKILDKETNTTSKLYYVIIYKPIEVFIKKVS